ncbi:Maltose phosphorylase / Trehalose phosphorylase [[Mycoplasma] cavipharyngis]|uniref:glycosyl hydrolase family 65 protein n=1 Tax=[Mycoplasma] cavipharyngis TaxID=92757 RepID=UPI00370448D2
MAIKLIYDPKNLLITQEGYDFTKTQKTESIFAQGNGYLGIRAVDEEFSSFNKEDFFINGIFNIGDPAETSELANMANLIQTQIFIDNKPLIINNSFQYSKTLDLKNGSLTRKITFNFDQKKFVIVFKRIVDQKNWHHYFQKISIKQLTGSSCIIKLIPLINGQTTNRGIQHFAEGTKHLLDPITIQYHEQTTESLIDVVHTMVVKFYNPQQKLLTSGNDNFVIKMARRQIGFEISQQLKARQTIVLEKNMSVYSTIDSDFPNKETIIKTSIANKEALKAISYDQVVNENNQIWKTIYQQFPVTIKGNNKNAAYHRLAFYFSIFHMNNFVPKNNSWLSVGAKGLSGEAYQGHCYWDTEFFIMPNYLFTNPQIARNLLEYRYKGIDGARKKAAEKNYLGAQYPWEMAWPTKGEVTPYWGQPDIITGKQIPIASREQEIHVSADIAYAVDQYYHVTQDHEFMEQMGYEMIIDTAIFWTSRVEWKNDCYQITNVMGPNEYKGNIDNNNFINQIAKRNLELAIKYIKQLQQTNEGSEILASINQKLPYQYSIDKMIDVKNKLVQQLPNKNKIIAENDQFLNLPLTDLKQFQMLGDAGKKLFNTQEGHKRLEGQIVKQADVILTTYLFNELYDKAICEANLNYYEPITTHDSSLSATTYCIQAIALRQMELAEKLFQYSINIDLGTNFASSNEGIHAGSLAAIWQTIVFGYGGLRYYDQKLHINPILPKSWNGLEYQILYQKSWLKVIVNQKNFSLEVIDGKKIVVYVNNQKVIVPNDQAITFKIITNWKKSN